MNFIWNTCTLALILKITNILQKIDYLHIFCCIKSIALFHIYNELMCVCRFFVHVSVLIYSQITIIFVIIFNWVDYSIYLIYFIIHICGFMTLFCWFSIILLIDNYILGWPVVSDMRSEVGGRCENVKFSLAFTILIFIWEYVALLTTYTENIHLTRWVVTYSMKHIF